MDGKILFVTTWAWTNALKSCRRNVENLAKVITGRLILPLNTCLKTKEVCVDDRVDSGGNSKSRTTPALAHSIRHPATKARRLTSLKWIVTRHLTPTNTVLPPRQFQLHRQPSKQKFPGNIRQNTLATLRPHNTSHLNLVYWITAEIIKHTSHTRMEVSWSLLSFDCPTFLKQHLSKLLLENLMKSLKSVRVFVSQHFLLLFSSKSITEKFHVNILKSHLRQIIYDLTNESMLICLESENNF